jgi:plastocyanin
MSTTVVLVGALAGCGSTSGTASSSPSVSDAGTTITITAADFMFTPATVDLAAGKAVTFKFVNTGAAEHSLTVGDSDITEAEPGETKTGTYTPTASGQIQFFCKYHKTSKSMVGSFNVTGAASGASAPASSPPSSSEANPYPY